MPVTGRHGVSGSYVPSDIACRIVPTTPASSSVTPTAAPGFSRRLIPSLSCTQSASTRRRHAASRGDGMRSKATAMAVRTTVRSGLHPHNNDRSPCSFPELHDSGRTQPARVPGGDGRGRDRNRPPARRTRWLCRTPVGGRPARVRVRRRPGRGLHAGVRASAPARGRPGLLRRAVGASRRRRRRAVALARPDTRDGVGRLGDHVPLRHPPRARADSPPPGRRARRHEALRQVRLPREATGRHHRDHRRQHVRGRHRRRPRRGRPTRKAVAATTPTSRSTPRTSGR